MSDEELRGRFRRDFQKETPRHLHPQRAKTHKLPVQRAATTAEIPIPHRAAAPTVPPAMPHIATMDEPKRPPKRVRRRKGRRNVFLVLLLIFVAGVGIAAYRYKTTELAIPVPAASIQSVDFPLLYPSKLPGTFKIKDSSFSTANNIVIFEANDANNNKLAFSVQERPSNFDYATFYKVGLANSTTFDTPLGQAAVGTTEGRLLGSIATDESWLLVTSSSKNVKASDIRLVLQNTKLASPTTK